MKIRNCLFGLALTGVLALGAILLIPTQTRNPLLGEWQITSKDWNPGLIGFRRITFVEQAMYTANETIPVRYQIKGNFVRVTAGFGDNVVYEVIDRNLICLPEIRRWPQEKAEWLFEDSVKSVRRSVDRNGREILIIGLSVETIENDPVGKNSQEIADFLHNYEDALEEWVKIALDTLQGRNCYQRI